MISKGNASVGLDLRIVELAAEEALCVEDSVDGVHRNLVLHGIPTRRSVSEKET